MKEYIVYPEHMRSIDTPGYRASYFYLHGKLDELNGYDICNVNDKLLQSLLRPGIRFATCTINEIKYNCLVICSYRMDRIEGYIVEINDFESIKDAMLKFKPNLCSDDSLEYIQENFIETFNYLRILFHSFN